MSGINSAKVNPGGGGPLFKKKIAKMSPPLTAFDPGYLQRKAAVPEQLFTLKNGKQLSYFTEGSVEDKAVVCLPSAGLGKCCFIPREPIPGVFLIAIDPMGHGNSSPIEKPTDFEESVIEVRELLDGLKVDKFYVLGWSCGGVHAMQISAALPGRVLGCAAISSPCDLHHPSLSKKEAKKLDEKGALILNQSGCLGGLVRWMMKGIYYYPDKTKDFGFAGHSGGGYQYYVGKETGGAPPEIEKDHFFVTKLLDSELNGTNSRIGLLLEMQGLFSRWPHDVAKIQCPCFLYIEQKGEVPLCNAERNQSLIPGSEMIVMKSHGHCSIMMEFEKIVAGLLEGKSIQCSFEKNMLFDK